MLRKGENRCCEVCGAEFYVTRGQLSNPRFRGGRFCSVECKVQSQRGTVPPWAKHDEKTLHSAGYVLVWKPDHPRASRGRVMEHILVMEEILGRPLEPGEHVHHKDRNKQNNHPDNLQLVTNAEHRKIHDEELRAVRFTQIEVQCRECGTVFLTKRSRALAENPQNQRKYCSEACRAKSWSRQMVAKRAEKRAVR